VDIEIVLDHDDGLGAREVTIGQVFQDVSVVHGGMAIRDFEAPAFERCKHHEEVGGAVARNRYGPAAQVSSGSAPASRR
jgi:hypothetical protein